MAIKSHIADPRNNHIAHVDKDALKVATRPLISYDNSFRFFTNDEFGIDLNINPQLSTNHIQVHDGTDNIYWTGSNIVGTKVVFNSADQSYTGTKSIKFDKPPVGEIAQVRRTTGLIYLAAYESVAMYIWNDDGNWSSGDEILIYGYNTSTASIVGNAVDLGDYVNIPLQDEWQYVEIPLEDMSLSDAYIDSFRFQVTVIAGGDTAKFYIDNLVVLFEEAGYFKVQPDAGTWLYVSSMKVSIVDAYSTILGNATMPYISYNTILGEPKLDNGIVYSRYQDGEVQSTFTIQQIFDLLRLPSTHIIGSGFDGTNSWIIVDIRFVTDLVLKPENNDYLLINIQEDLSGFVEFNISAGCKIEYR